MPTKVKAIYYHAAAEVDREKNVRSVESRNCCRTDTEHFTLCAILFRAASQACQEVKAHKHYVCVYTLTINQSQKR